MEATRKKQWLLEAEIAIPHLRENDFCPRFLRTVDAHMIRRSQQVPFRLVQTGALDDVDHMFAWKSLVLYIFQSITHHKKNSH